MKKIMQMSRTRRELTPNGVNFIVRHEGYSQHVYKDSAGNPTIGYGHLIRGDEKLGPAITPADARRLLEADVRTSGRAVNRGLEVWTSQNQFDALVSFTFNVGGGNFSTSTVLRKINDVADVKETDFTVWNKSGGRADPNLTERRRAEYNLFVTP